MGLHFLGLVAVSFLDFLETYSSPLLKTLQQMHHKN